MDKTVLIEQTSKRLKRWELVATAMLFLTLFAGFWLRAQCDTPRCSCARPPLLLQKPYANSHPWQVFPNPEMF